jgi:putative transposase
MAKHSRVYTATGREWQAEEVGGRPDTGSGDVAGRAAKKLVKPSCRRAVVKYLCGGYRVSERRACTVVLLPRATHRNQSIRDPMTALRMRLRELAQARIPYGYRKLRVLLIRDGWQVARSWFIVCTGRRSRDCRGGPRHGEWCRSTAGRSRGQSGRIRSGAWISWPIQLSDGRRFRALTVVDVLLELTNLVRFPSR